MNWITMKISPAAMAARPAMPVSLAVVMVTVSSFVPAFSRQCHGMRFNVGTNVVTGHRLMM